MGHSMGGSVAALLCHLMRTHLSSAPAPDSTSPHQGKTSESPRSLALRGLACLSCTENRDSVHNALTYFITLHFLITANEV
jgi:hypothetical protein